MTPPISEVASILAHLVAGRPDAALVLATRTASGAGASKLTRALIKYLSSDPSASVYEAPAAFEAFINGGGNTKLYERVGNALAELYRTGRTTSLLDIGCGDGQALVAALSVAADRASDLDLVEPSVALLTTAVRRLAEVRPAAAVQAWPMDLQDLLAATPADRRYSLAQSTFALHAIRTDQRTGLLRDLRERVSRLAVVEFDVPALPPGSPTHLQFLADSYERGLGEYDADRDLVAQGFLMPVLVGQLSPGAVRSTWEQPADAWRSQVEAAGYSDVRIQALSDYWSSPAFLLTARGA